MEYKWLKNLFLLVIITAFFPFDGQLIVLFGFSLFILILILREINKDILHINLFQTRYSLLLIIWLLWSFASIIWVENRYTWLVTMGVLFISSVSGLVLTYLYKNKSFSSLLRLTMLFVLITHQIFAWAEWLSYLLQFGWEVTLYNPMWFFGNINDFAMLQLFIIFYVLYWRQKWNPSFVTRQLSVGLKALVIGSSLLLILLATSRGIFASAIFGLLVYGILSIDNRKLQKKIWTGLGITLLVLLLPLFQIVMSDLSIQVRDNLVLNGFEYLKMTNYLGVGAGNISHYLENFVFFEPIFNHNVIHNWFMGILVTNGLVFFLIYTSYYLYAFMKSFKIAFTTQNHRAKFLVSWLAAFFIASVIPNSLFHIMWFWFIHHFTFIEFEELNNCDIESKV